MNNVCLSPKSGMETDTEYLELLQCCLQDQINQKSDVDGESISDKGYTKIVNSLRENCFTHGVPCLFKNNPFNVAFSFYIKIQQLKQIKRNKNLV